MTRFVCRHCGDDTGTSDSHLCGRCACLPTLERGRQASQLAARERQPGDDDDRRQPSRCNHCLTVGSGNPCPTCRALIADIDAPAPNGHLETDEDARERRHAERVESCRAAWRRQGRRLLARAGTFPGGLERAQPKQ